MWLKLFSLMLWWIVVVSVVGAQEFSISRVVPQEKADDDFSIYKRTRIVESRGKDINFSINAKPRKSAVDVPPPPANTPEHAQARVVNRVLVFHHTKPWNETVLKAVKVCNGSKCWTETRRVQVEHLPTGSQKFLQELKSLKQWKCDPDVDAHFVPIDVDDPKNHALVKEFKVERKDLPLLVKETDGKIRRSAEGMSGTHASEWWNSTFQKRDIAEPQGSLFRQDDHHQWTHPGNIRHHLMDPKFPHHLPKAVIDTWTDKQCEAWHNWHHQILSGQRAISKPLSQMTKPRISTQVVSLGYPKGSQSASISAFAQRVAHQVARAPPRQSSFSSDPKKAAKELKKWKSKERDRIKKEVRRQVWNQYATFDPFTWWAILSILFRVLSLIYDMYGLR